MLLSDVKINKTKTIKNRGVYAFDSKLTVSPMSLVYKPVEGIGVNLFLVYLISHKFSFTIC